MTFLAGYPEARPGPARQKAPPIGLPHRGYAHRTKVAAWKCGGYYSYMESTLEKPNFQATKLGDKRLAQYRSCILSPQEQLLSRIDRYQMDPEFREEMRERYRTLMGRIGGRAPGPPTAARLKTSTTRRVSASASSLQPLPGTAAGADAGGGTEEKPAGPQFRSCETQTGPDLDRVATIRQRPQSAKLFRSKSTGLLPRTRPQSAKLPRPRSGTLQTLEQAMLG